MPFTFMLLLMAASFPCMSATIELPDIFPADLDEQTSLQATDQAFANKLNAASRLIASGDYRQAISALKQLRNDHPGSMHACYLLSVSHVGLRHWSEALAVADECIAIEENWPVIYSLKGAILAGMDRKEQALVQYDHMIELDPDDPSGYRQRAKAYYVYFSDDRSALSQAKDDLDRHVALGGRPEKATALYGILYAKLHRHQEAISHLVAALDNEPGHFEALRTLLDLYREQKQFDAADALFENALNNRALFDQRQISELYLAQAHTAQAKNSPASAEASFRASLKAMPENLQARKAFIHWLDRQARLKETIPLAREGLKIRPDEAYFTAYLAWALAATAQDLSQAKKWLLKAKQQDPENVFLSDTEAWIHVREGRYRKALRTIQPSLEYAGKLPEIAYHAGVIHYHLGNPARAADYWRLSLEQETLFQGRKDAKALLHKVNQER